MEAGFARLNDLTLIQISNGMSKHILNEFSSDRRVVVGYDTRHNSKRLHYYQVIYVLQLCFRFAQLAANVFIQNGLKFIYLVNIEYVPTYSCCGEIFFKN